MSWVIRLLIPAIFFQLIFASPALHAEEYYSNKAVVEYKGKKGYWFDEETGDKMLQDLIEFKHLKFEKIPALELKLKLQNYDLELHKRDVQYADKMYEKCEEKYKESEELRIKETQYLREKLEEKNAWYRSPPFYLISGVILGGLLAVGLEFGLQRN